MDLNFYKQELLKRKSALESESERGEESRQAVELDQTTQGRLSRQDALQHQALAQAGERNRQLEIYKIEEALKRIDTGDYGYCLSCDEEIAEKRLKHNPAVATCINCAH